MYNIIYMQFLYEIPFYAPFLHALFRSGYVVAFDAVHKCAFVCVLMCMRPRLGMMSTVMTDDKSVASTAHPSSRVREGKYIRRCSF